jgi:hypothetical protein
MRLPHLSSTLGRITSFFAPIFGERSARDPGLMLGWCAFC